jgi:thiol-disulfide isomerase/thioredoxin
MPLVKTDAPALENVDEWINSDPVDLDEGSHLVYFWSYSCKCCKDRLKLFQRIHEKYPEINVIGIHNPKFGFEKDGGNLRKAVQKLGINHAVVQDTQRNVSEEYNMAFSNQALIVSEGSIVYQQTGKIGIEDLVSKISEILEANKEVETSDLEQERSSQEFFGYSRTSGLNREGNHPGKKDYQLPQNRIEGETYLKGVWEQKEDYIEAKEDSKLFFNFESSEANLIADPNNGMRDIEILIDGEPVPEEKAGEDLRIEDGRSYIRVNHPDLYNLFDSKYQEYEITVIPDKKTRLYALSFK